MVGEGDDESAERLIQIAADRVGGRRIQLTTDGYQAYITATLKAFGHRIDLAQLIKVFNPADPPGK